MSNEARNEDRAPYHVPGRPSALEHYTEQARLAIFDQLHNSLSDLLSMLATCRTTGKLKGGELSAEADARRLLARLPGAPVPVEPAADPRALSDRELKLYVFEGFCPDYTSGLAFAIAADEDEARRLIVEQRDEWVLDWGKLSIHPLNVKIARSVVGGG